MTPAITRMFSHGVLLHTSTMTRLYTQHVAGHSYIFTPTVTHAWVARVTNTHTYCDTLLWSLLTQLPTVMCMTPQAMMHTYHMDSDRCKPHCL